MKKHFARLLVVTLLAASFLLTSCKTGSGDSSSTPTANSSETSTVSNESSDADSSTPSADQPYDLPIVTDGSVTISISSPDCKVKGYSYTDGLPVWTKLEEETGIKIDWRVTPSSDYDSVIQTQLAAGVDLADFIDVPDGSPMKYVNDGLIVPITEQLDKYGYYTNQYYEANPYMKPFVTGTDGEVYFFSSDIAGSYLTDPRCWMIREDWLEKFDLDMPETLDDWYNVWKTFLDEDANGNGERDEIPFLTTDIVGSFGDTYGLNLDIESNGWMVDKDGKVQYGYAQPELKEFLAWASKCYAEGLISQDFANLDADTTNKQLGQGLAGSTTSLVNYIAQYNKLLASSNIDGKYVAVPTPPKKDANSEPSIVPIGGPTVLTWGFSKDCEDLDTKFKFIDYCYASQSAVYGMCFGIEGQSYEIGDDGLPYYTSYALDNPDMGMNSVIRSLGGMPYFPFIRGLNGYWSHGVLQTNKDDPELAKAAENMQPYLAQAFPRRMLMSEDETATYGQYMADIETRVKEMMTNFVMGRESLDKFDEYVDGLYSMGLDKVLEVRQAQYDRYLEASK